MPLRVVLEGSETEISRAAQQVLLCAARSGRSLSPARHLRPGVGSCRVDGSNLLVVMLVYCASHN